MEGFGLYVKTLAVYLFFGVGVLAVTSLIALALTTVRSLYSGDMVTRPGYRTTGMADVLNCVEAGPLTKNGVGMWWECDVVVKLVDGRSVRTTVSASIVTPEDKAKSVEIVEYCRLPEHRECTYARPGNLILTLWAGIVRILAVAVLFCGLGLSAVAFLVGLLGVRVTSKLQHREGRRGGRTMLGEVRIIPGEGIERGAMATDIPAGFGELIVDLRYDSDARAIYETLTPMVRVDGAPPRTKSSWGEVRIPVLAGERKCEVWIPFESFRFGYVARKFAVIDGSRISMYYKAPRTPGAAGTLELL
ncbi:DUF6346 domain-containing protein [Plantactinospora sp. WMMC1484]|uniref:DUF6346 domain-containing protein n=1 Tax=Plantactinospora sp. WMMC1484 TaxID=3404122 RepID=UPI003BF5F7D7